MNTVDTKALLAIADELDEWGGIEEAVAQLRALAAQADASKGEPAREVSCSSHPDAPHGFMRNASHSEDRYVCECELWTPPSDDTRSTIETPQRKFPILAALWYAGVLTAILVVGMFWLALCWTLACAWVVMRERNKKVAALILAVWVTASIIALLVL